MSITPERRFPVSKVGTLKATLPSQRIKAIVARAGHLQQPPHWNLWLSLKGLIRNCKITRYNNLSIATLRISNVKVAGCLKLLSIHKLKELFLRLNMRDLTRQEQESAKIDHSRVILGMEVNPNRKH